MNMFPVKFLPVMVLVVLLCSTCGNEDSSGQAKKKPGHDERIVNTEHASRKGKPEITLFRLTSTETTKNRLITFDLRAGHDSDITGWYVSEDPIAPLSGQAGWKKQRPSSWLMSAGRGQKILYAWIRDSSGSISDPAILVVELDHTPPEIVLFDVQGQRSHADREVKLEIISDQAREELSWYLSEGATPPPPESAAWKSAKPSSWTLSPGDGTKTINVWAMDRAGNISGKRSVSVYFKSRPCLVEWEPNRGQGVNSPGGGYIVMYSSKKDFTRGSSLSKKVPYVSGLLAPTSTTLNLSTGTWHIKIRGYSSLGHSDFSDAVCVTIHK